MGNKVDKVLRVSGVDYVIDEGDIDIAKTLASVKQALKDKSVVEVPVLDDKRNRLTLLLNGAQVDTVVFDLGEGPRPGELSP